MSKVLIELPRHQRRQILRFSRKSTSRVELQRCQILLMLCQGLGVIQICGLLNCVRATAYRTLYRFQELGQQGLFDKRTESRPKKANQGVLYCLKTIVSKSPSAYGWNRTGWTLELLSREIMRMSGTTLSRSHIRRLLRKLAIHRTRAKPTLRIPVRGRRAILRKIAKLVQNASASEEVFYSDEADVDLNPRIGYTYTPKGTQVEIPTPGKNKKSYLAGALNCRTGRVCYVSGERKNSDLFLDLVHHLSSIYRRAKKVHIILDNYVIHKSKRTLTEMKKYGGRIVFHFLPPYSPQDNPIERLWKQMHDAITRNHLHPNLDSLLKSVFRFLDAASPFPGKEFGRDPCTAYA